MKKYYIWSIQHGAWWKPNKHGYTRYKYEAGIYNEKEANEIVRDANIISKCERKVLADNILNLRKV